MSRRLALAGLAALIVLVALAGVRSLRDTPPTTGLTLAEIDAEAARLKADMKAELAAQGKLYEPGAFPNDWAFAQRAYPYNRINIEELDRALEDAQALRLAASRERNVEWVERGPTNIGARGGGRGGPPPQKNRRGAPPGDPGGG